MIFLMLMRAMVLDIAMNITLIHVMADIFIDLRYIIPLFLFIWS